MDDETALRVEQVKLAFETADRVTSLRARRHVAVLAVALAGLVSSVGAGLLGQAPWSFVGAAVAALAIISVQQIISLDRLERTLAAEGTRAHEALESLMTSGGDSDADATEVHSG